jgi:hypothetical protein
MSNQDQDKRQTALRGAMIGDSEASSVVAQGQGARVGVDAVVPTVIVVGAGISGCACAAVLASLGLRVTLMNSAMDGVALPAYGPDLIGRDHGWRHAEEALRGLPQPLRRVWLEASTAPACETVPSSGETRGRGGAPAVGQPILNVDRREISIEAKRVLEQMPGLQFRQGFVIDLRVLPDQYQREQRANEECGVPSEGSSQPIEVETIFGEILRADAVVVAVGLSLVLGVGSGSASLPGGRYGEPASNGLAAALALLGAKLQETTVEVGPRVSTRSAKDRGWLRDTDLASWKSDWGAACNYSPTERGSGGLIEERLLPVVQDPSPDSWPAGYPPAPHRQRRLRTERMVVAMDADEKGDARWLPVLSPDGAATSEVYVAAGSSFAEQVTTVPREEGVPIASRMPLTAKGMVVRGLSGTGRMRCDGELAPIWIVGRAAGAEDYVDSLASGVQTARDIQQSMSRCDFGSAAADR